MVWKWFWLYGKRKKSLKEFPPLYHPNIDDKLIIKTDASNNYWGGILKAINLEDQSKDLICRYTSEYFKDAERNYHSNEKEYLAVKRVIEKFSSYLTPVNFTVIRDNKNFPYFLRNNISGDNKQGRLVWLQMWFSGYNFKVENIKREKNIFADFLTREFQH